MKYKENKTWKNYEKADDLRNAVETLFEELRTNCEAVEKKEPSKRRHIARTLYYSVAYKRHHIVNYSNEQLKSVLKELKTIRSFMKDVMDEIK